MRHIKIFEGFSTHEYYVEIDYDEWMGGKRTKLPEKYSRLLLSIPKYKPRLKGVQGIYGDTISLCRATYGLYPSNISVTMIEDYYFLCRIDDKFYKCDHFEGVIELLKYYKVLDFNYKPNLRL